MNAAQNFVKNARKTLRDDSEMEVIRAKKGKRNKPVRGKDNWGNLDMFTTPESCKQRHADSVHFSTQRPAWEII